MEIEPEAPFAGCSPRLFQVRMGITRAGQACLIRAPPRTGAAFFERLVPNRPDACCFGSGTGTMIHRPMLSLCPVG